MKPLRLGSKVMKPLRLGSKVMKPLRLSKVKGHEVFKVK